MRNGVLTFFNRRKIVDLIRHVTVIHFAIGRLKEPVLIGPRKNSKRVDKADIWTFRRFNRTHPTIMGRVHVAHLETGAFPRQSAWSKRRYATLVCHFRERVVLVHELRKLTGPKELFDYR